MCYYFSFGRHEETLEELFSTRPPIDELKESLCQFLRKKQHEIRNKQRETDDVKMKITGEESEKKIIKYLIFVSVFFVFVLLDSHGSKNAL